MKESFLGRSFRRAHERIEDFIDSAHAKHLGKKMGEASIRTSNLISKREKQHPDLKGPNKIDPALKALLEAKLKDGRLSHEDFESELAKYDRE